MRERSRSVKRFSGWAPPAVFLIIRPMDRAEGPRPVGRRPSKTMNQEFGDPAAGHGPGERPPLRLSPGIPTGGGEFSDSGASRGRPSEAGWTRSGEGGPGFPPPRRPERRRSRFWSVLVGLMIVIGLGGLALLILVGTFLAPLFGGRGSGLLGDFGLHGKEIALLRIDGTIVPGPYYDFWIKTLRALREQRNLRGVLLRIDSPGGTVGASQELHDEVLKLRREAGKTVYVSMGDVAASGAYYIAIAADRIFANRGTLTGSVGVISTTYHVEGLAEKAGVGFEVIKKGRFKDAGSLFRPMTEEERRVFDLLINNSYEQFVEDVLTQRRTRLEESLQDFEARALWEEFLFERPEAPDARNFLLQIADGRAYTGEQALRLGLIDELGSLSHALARMTDELGIVGRPAVYEPQMRVTIFDLLTARIDKVLPQSLSHPSLQYRMLPF